MRCFPYNTCAVRVSLTPIPERLSLQCRKHSFPHPSVHQTDRYYYYCYYCSSRGWNIFKHWVFKNISFYNELYNFSQIYKFLQRKILLKIVVFYSMFLIWVLIGPLCVQKHKFLRWYSSTFVSTFQKACFLSNVLECIIALG